MNNVLKTVITGLLTLILVSCGSGSGSSSSSSLNTGVFLDSAVRGLIYKTATQLGTTDIDGKFKYKDGEAVEFYLGNLKLGESAGSNILYPKNIAVRNDYEVAMGQLLQTLDFDSDLSNGINVLHIHKEFTNNMVFDGIVDQSMINLMRSGEELSEDDSRYRELISAESAEQHLRDTENGDSSNPNPEPSNNPNPEPSNNPIDLTEIKKSEQGHFVEILFKLVDSNVKVTHAKINNQSNIQFLYGTSGTIAIPEHYFEKIGDLCLIIACWGTASDLAFIKNKSIKSSL